MIQLFFRSLRNRRVESLAAMLIIALTVAALIVQDSLAKSAEKQVHDLVHNLGNNMLVLPAETDVGSFYRLEYGPATLPMDYPERLLSSSVGQHIRGIRPNLYGNIEAQGVPLVLIGEQELFGPGSSSAPDLADRVILGPAAAVRLGLGVGDALTLAGRELHVALVADSMREGLDTAVLVELSTAQLILDKPAQINAITLGGCWCSMDIPALAKQVESHLPGTRALTVAGVTQSQQGAIETVGRYSTLLSSVGFALIGVIVAVLVAVQVRRQLREVGLLLAVGARSLSITVFFVAMAALIATAGSLLGLALGDPLTRWVSATYMGGPLSAVTDGFAAIFAMTVGVSIVAALLPAWRAATIDPTTLLRDV